MSKEEQEETLVEIRMMTDSLEVTLPRRSSQDGFKWMLALATLIGFIAVAVVGIIVHVFFSQSSCNQEATQMSDPANIRMICKFKESDDPKRHDIFTVEKTKEYLIYGWLTFSRATGEDISLIVSFRQEDKRTLQTKKINSTEIFFFKKVQVVKNMRISVMFGTQYISKYTAGCFHVYELIAE